MKSPDKIFIVGMPGSGKTTLSSVLQQQLNKPRFDLDDVIIESEGMSIAEIFTNHGEDHFRRLETEYLKKLSNQHEEFVISCGGGTPCFNHNMQFMNERGTTVFINTRLDVIADRISREKHRPLVKSGGDVVKYVEDTYAVRKDYYHQADYEINETFGTEDLIKKLRELRTTDNI